MAKTLWVKFLSLTTKNFLTKAGAWFFSYYVNIRIWFDTLQKSSHTLLEYRWHLFAFKWNISLVFIVNFYFLISHKLSSVLPKLTGYNRPIPQNMSHFKGEGLSFPEFLPNHMSEPSSLQQHFRAAASSERCVCTRGVATGFSTRNSSRGAKAANWNHHYFSPPSDITSQVLLLSQVSNALFPTWRKRFHFGLTWNREGMFFQ